MKHFIISVILMLSTLMSFGQKAKVKNLQNFERKTIHFGFSLGVNSANLGVHRYPIKPLDSLMSINVVSDGGFNLGIVSELHMGNHLGLRFVPTLIFAQRSMEFNFINPDKKAYMEERIIESTYLDFPLLLKYSSARLNNFAAYIIAGGKFSYDLASSEAVKNEEIAESIIKIKKSTINAEVGIGTDFYLPYFKFSIEAKMSYAIRDALIHDATELSTPIEKILPKMFLLTFLFEG